MGVLVAGVGNILRGDDGFGVVAAQRMMSAPVPAGVRVVETGIGGIHLVQELMAGAEALIVIDAMDLGKPPGTVLVQRPAVLDVATLGPQERRDQLADMHYSTPERAFMLAGALGVLPEQTWVVGCQPVDAQSYVTGLHRPVADAVSAAITEVLRLAHTALAPG